MNDIHTVKNSKKKKKCSRMKEANKSAERQERDGGNLKFVLYQKITLSFRYLLPG